MNARNPHLEMANDVFNRMFGLPTITPPDPLSADEASEGVCALPELTAEQMAEGDYTEIRR